MVTLLLEKILSSHFGETWHEEAFDSEKTWGQKLLTPSLIYSSHILYLLQREFPLRGIAHVTGGGLAGNLERILAPWNKGALLHSLHTPHEEMLGLQDLGRISERQSYETWNMGNGMLLVLPPEHLEALLCECKERGLHAKHAGSIDGERRISIRSQGQEKQELNFPYED